MKRDIRYTLLIAAVGVLGLVSCRKNYHCQCSYNNSIKQVIDLGSKTKDDATDACDAYDTTVTGERWNCIIY